MAELMMLMAVVLPVACFLAPAVGQCDCGVCTFKRRLGMNPCKQ